jgi:acyl-coenzyme A synthetase/AMP-(fatty) acid ligase
VQRVYNLYGPSEDTTYSTWALLPAASNGPVPIGEPINNTQCYVLDASGQPVPIGVNGELYLGGAGLARGYLGQPALTAERFVPHPFSSQPGARLYRTGDLVRILPDGQLTFVGRVDSQIKLRGYRIELEEIEATLRQHPLVHEAAVTIQQATTGDRRLVAYVVTHDSSLTQQALLAFLSQQLPDYMLPGLVVWLNSFPLSPNGKLDRRHS